MAPVEINQKKRSNRLKFTFNDDSFNHAYKDRTGSGDIDVQYAALGLITRTATTENGNVCSELTEWTQVQAGRHR